MLKMFVSIFLGVWTFFIIGISVIFFLAVSSGCSNPPRGCEQKVEIDIQGQPSKTADLPALDDETDKEIEQLIGLFCQEHDDEEK